MFGKKKTHGSAVAVFDVSSGSIGGAHVLLEGAVPVILASGRIDAPLQEDLDVARLVDGTADRLRDTARTLAKADLHRPEVIHLILASPWYVSQTRTIQYKKETPFTFTKKLLHELIEQEIAHVVEHELERFGTFGKEGSVVEKQISLVKLNGYATGDPYGKECQSVELFMTLTVAPKKIIDRFVDVLHREYGPRKVAVTTSPYATFVATRDYFAAQPDAVIIDVGEEVTDVAFVKSGLFLYQHSFPVGTFGLYRAVMDKHAATAMETKALIEAFRLGKTGAASAHKMERAVQEFSTLWQKEFQGVLRDGNYGLCLPSICYITADPRFEGTFPAIIASDPFVQHMCSYEKVRAVFLNEALFEKKVSMLDGTFDVPLATAALFAARMVA